MPQIQVIEGTGEELIRHLTERSRQRFRLISLPEDNVFQPFDKAFAAAQRRTPYEIAAARARAIAASPIPREIPRGKTLAEVVMGAWPGTESDEQIQAALEKLS